MKTMNLAARAAPTYVKTIVYDGKVTPREQLVLFAINTRELYGLAIQQAIQECSNGRERFGIGTLYPTLRGLEQKGLVIGRWGDETPEERGGARRRYYRLSDTGRAAVQQVLDFQQRLLNWADASNP